MLQPTALLGSAAVHWEATGKIHCCGARYSNDGEAQEANSAELQEFSR